MGPAKPSPVERNRKLILVASDLLLLRVCPSAWSKQVGVRLDGVPHPTNSGRRLRRLEMDLLRPVAASRDGEGTAKRYVLKSIRKISTQT